jgi:hypothetical protein
MGATGYGGELGKEMVGSILDGVVSLRNFTKTLPFQLLNTLKVSLLNLALEKTTVLEFSMAFLKILKYWQPELSYGAMTCNCGDSNPTPIPPIITGVLRRSQEFSVVS